MKNFKRFLVCLIGVVMAMTVFACDSNTDNKKPLIKTEAAVFNLSQPAPLAIEVDLRGKAIVSVKNVDVVGGMFSGIELVEGDDYTASDTQLVFDSVYLWRVGFGEHDYELKTQGGTVRFKINAIQPIWKYSEQVEYSKYIQRLTGSDSPNRTDSLDSGWNVGGTDLGFPIFNSVTNKMHYAFGDTFANANQQGLWRSNVMAESSDLDPSDGITIDDFFKHTTLAAPIIEGKHNLETGVEATKIPTGGIEIDGKMYMFYMSIRQWDGWIVNYCGAVRSVDNGASWQRFPELTWVLTDGSTYVGTNLGLSQAEIDNINNLPVAAKHLDAQRIANDILDLANQDVYGLSPSAIGSTPHITDLEPRVAPNFGQIFPIDGKDGYVYIMGIPGGRSQGVKLGRVLKENFEVFAEYEYYTGTVAGQPVWVKGSDGLKAIFNNDNSFIIKQAQAELSFMYNEYLGKWMSVNCSGGLHFRLADNPWGPYAARQEIIKGGDLFIPYGGHVHEKLTKENGKYVYIVISQWMPIYNSGIIEMKLV